MKSRKSFLSCLLTILSILCLVFAFGGCNPSNINLPQNLPVFTYIWDSERHGYILTGGDLKENKEIVIPALYNDRPVIGITQRAFHHNDNLTNVIIPDSIIYIGKDAFLDCDNLTKTEYGNGYYIGTEENPYFALINLKENITTCNIHNQTKIIKESIFERNKNLTNVIIGNSILSIENHTFDSCYNLTSVTIGNSVISIGEEAFDGCSSLTNVTIPESVTSIGEDAFAWCSSLTSVTIGNSVTSIGKDAFAYCSSLTSITIPDSVTSIGGWAFDDCDSLTSVYIESIEAWCKIDFESSVSNPLYYAENLYLNNQLVTDLVIPNTVTQIKNCAFYGGNFKAVTIPNSITSIGEGAFEYCSSLTSVAFGNSVTSIGDFVFASCSNLTNVTIPNSVSSIGFRAFYGCDSLTSVTFENTEGWWRSTSSTATSGTSISATALADPSTAATYLMYADYNYYWKRTVAE